MGANESFARRLRVALITNHGYAGPSVPSGGAPDTGGQNVYVNAMVGALVEIGYHVTVFTRGGFPAFDSDRLREGIEPFGPHARYVYVPGGGASFLRKEDIAIALDEEVDWLEAFVAREAADLGCRPWEVYEIVNTHYWDAGVMGMTLTGRWRSTLALERIGALVAGALAGEQEGRLERLDGRSAAGQAPAFVLGQLLYASTDATLSPPERTAAAVRRWCVARALRADEAVAARAAARAAGDARSPALVPIAAAEAIGAAIEELVGARLADELAGVDRHVFTPHSLAVLKDENSRAQGLRAEDLRSLKLAERRAHEAVVGRSARAVAATSVEIAERLHASLGIELGRIFFFPPCIDRTRFKRYEGRAVDRAYAFLARRTGVPEASLRASRLIFETSRMDRTKRKDLLLRAFATTARQVRDAYLLVGGGPENDVYEELRGIRDADPLLRTRAFLLGFIPDEVMYPLFSMADLFVSGSEMEGFGMSVSQAAAVGTPIITSHLVPFAAEYASGDAVVVAAGDVDGFARAMTHLLEDDREREARGRRLERRTAALDWVVQAGALIDHLRRCGLRVRRPRPTIEP